MKATFVALGVVAVLAAAAPAVAGVTGNSALSREIDVKTAPSPSATSHSPSPSATVTPGDDKGGLRTSHTSEADDDHGGRRGGDDDNSGRGNSGSGSGSGNSGHGGGSDDGPNHD